MSFVDNGSGTVINLGKGVALNGEVNGFGNIIDIGGAKNGCQINLFINGNNNNIKISRGRLFNALTIKMGNHVPANNTLLEIDKGFSCGSQNVFLLYNSGNLLKIGADCMFSRNITIRCGDSPHLIFERTSGRYLDISEGVFIGSHVWVGENVYVTKNVTISDESVVGACSVVTRRFLEANCIIAGNPASVVRNDIQWKKNASMLDDGSPYKTSFDLEFGKYNI